VTKALPRLATGMTSGRDPAVLGSIALEGVGVAVWERTVPTDFQRWLDALPVAALPRLRRTLLPSWVGPTITLACLSAGMPAGPHREALAADVALLARLAAEALGAQRLEVRLDVTTDQACPKWHLDAVRARLICAYRGPGTEFGPAHPNGEPASVQALPTGVPALFRGLLWPSPDLTGIVHRSPPAIPGQARLVLVIDAEEA
jgi:hypothetical protein